MRGSRCAALSVLMLTTAAAAFCAAMRRLPAGGGPLTVVGTEGASTSDTPAPEVRGTGPRPIHSGLSVATTNHAASRTVTDCEKTSQKRRMTGSVDNRVW